MQEGPAQVEKDRIPISAQINMDMDVLESLE